MEGKIYEIFPKVVMKFKLDREFNNKELLHFDYIQNYVKIAAHSDGVSDDHYVLNNESMSSLKAFCENCLNEYLNKIYCPSDNSVKVYITQSWINYLRKDHTHSMHAHSNSFLSGVLYISMDDDTDSIEFIKNEYLPIRFKSKEINDYNAEDVEFKVKKYELLIFPSNLYHQVPPNKSDKLRISLAFNSYINGTISNDDTLYGLKL